MSKRKNMSKVLRFTVFKRDSFCCQYCGNSPPSVVLEVDHITPVSKGGENDLDNLATSCFDCNRGKSNHNLGEVPATVAEKLRIANERELQVSEFDKLMRGQRRRIAKSVDEVVSIYEEKFTGFTVSSSFRASIKRFVEKLPLHEVIEAMETAVDYKPNAPLKYFCGICWNKIRRDQQHAK